MGITDLDQEKNRIRIRSSKKNRIRLSKNNPYLDPTLFWPNKIHPLFFSFYIKINIIDISIPYYSFDQQILKENLNFREISNFDV